MTDYLSGPTENHRSIWKYLDMILSRESRFWSQSPEHCPKLHKTKGSVGGLSKTNQRLNKND